MSLAHSPSIPLNGLLLCVDAANSKSPAYGNTTITLNNGLAAAANGYYTFDGIDDNIGIQSSVYNVPYTGKTMVAAVWTDPSWVYSGSGTYKAIIGTGSNQNLRNFNFYLFRDSVGVRLHLSQGNGAATYGTLSGYLPSYSNSQWNIVAVSQQQDGTHTYYCNGQSVGSSSSVLTQYNAGTTETLGYSDNTFIGRIAFWHVYSRGLTGSEIQQSFNAMRGRFGL